MAILKILSRQVSSRALAGMLYCRYHQRGLASLGLKNIINVYRFYKFQFPDRNSALSLARAYNRLLNTLNRTEMFRFLEIYSRFFVEISEGVDLIRIWE